MEDSTSGRYLALKTVMMPRDTNPYGTIFGGVILSYIDQAGAVGVHHEIRSRGWPDQPIVTVALKSVEFHQPVFVGEPVSFWTYPKHIGKTSITMAVSVETERDGQPLKLTDAEVTFVAIRLPERLPTPLRGEGASSDHS
jgi:acyl-CoA thioesterase YciA